MNKKAEEYLIKNNDIAECLLNNKKLYEKRIEKNIRENNNLSNGIAIGYRIAATDNKRLLKKILMGGGQVASRNNYRPEI